MQSVEIDENHEKDSNTFMTDVKGQAISAENASRQPTGDQIPSQMFIGTEQTSYMDSRMQPSKGFNGKRSVSTTG